jgi:hypothetical protein
MLWSAQQRRVLPIIYHAVSPLPPQKKIKFMAWVFGETVLNFWRRNLMPSAISAEDRGIPQFQGLHQVPYFASAVLDVLCLERRSATYIATAFRSTLRRLRAKRIRCREFPLQLSYEAVSRCLYFGRQ